jgi:hypothetical protein
VRNAAICLLINFNSAGRSRGFFCILFSAIGKKFVREATGTEQKTTSSVFCLEILFDAE